MDQRQESVVRRMLAGQSPAVVEAALRAAERYRVTPDARVQATWLSRTFTLTGATGQPGGVDVRVVAPLLVTHWTASFRSTDAADLASQVGLRLSVPSAHATYIGDVDTYVDASVPTDRSFPLPVCIPWLLTPGELARVDASVLSTLAGDVTMSIAFGGVYLFGWAG